MDKLAFREIQKKLKLTNEGVSEAMDVELFIVQQWASGVWLIPKAMAKFLRTLLSAQRDMEAVYMSGYHRGHNTGGEEGRLAVVEDYTTEYDQGHSDGCCDTEDQYEKIVDAEFLQGKKQGKNEGMSIGYTEGYVAAMKAVGIF
jgi:hypothetical protein